MGPPTGGQRQITVQVVYAVNQASMQQAAAAVQNFGVQPLRQVNQAAQQTGATLSLLGQKINVAQIIAWGLAWSVAYQALNLVTGLISALTIGAVQRLAEWQQRQIMLAAEFINLDPSIPFNKAFDAADKFLNLLLDMQPAFIGTRGALQEIFVATVRYFGAVDLSTAKAKNDFLAFANGIALAQIGINRAGSSFREVAALIEGVVRPGAQFLTMLAKIDPKIKEHIDLWRRQGTVIENIAKLLPGYAVASERIVDTFQSQLGRIEANVDRIIRRVAPGGLIMAILKGVGAVTADPAIAVPAFEALLVTAFTIAASKTARTIALRVVTAVAAALGGGIPILVYALAAVLGQAVADPIVAALFEKVLRQPGIEKDIQNRLVTTRLVDVRAIEAQMAEDPEERLKDISQAWNVGRASVTDYLAALQAVADMHLRNARLATGTEQEQQYKKWKAALRDIQQVQVELVIFGERAFLRPLQTREQILRFEMSITESLQRRREILGQLLIVQEKRIELLQEEAEAAAKAGRPPQVVEERQKAVLDAQEAAAKTRHEVEITGRSIRQIIARNEAEILRIGQRAFTARMLDLESQRVEELRLVEGNYEARRAIEKKFILQRLQILEDARKAQAEAEAEFASTRIRNIQQQGDLQQRLLQSRTAMIGFGMPLAPESTTQVRERFEQLRSVQRASQQAALADAETSLRLAKSMEQRAEQTARLYNLILNQTEAQAGLNREEREALRTAKERDLSNEIRLLERRLTLIQQLGGTDFAATQRRLDQAKAEEALRKLTAPELRQELEFGRKAGFAAPPAGLDPAVWDRIVDKSGLIRKILGEISDEGKTQVVTLGAQDTRLDALLKSMQKINAEMLVGPGAAVKNAVVEYKYLFDAVQAMLDKQAEVWRIAGDAAGKAYADAAKVHLKNIFPKPSSSTDAGDILAGGGGTPMPSLAQTISEGPMSIVASMLGNTGPTYNIQIDGMEVSRRLDAETMEKFLAAVFGSQGDRTVQRAERFNVASPVV
jgi:hypothetical protein